MFKKNFYKKSLGFLLLMLLGLSPFAQAQSTENIDEDLLWIRELAEKHDAMSASNIVLLGPAKQGKSTLTNILLMTSEYATLEEKGAVLLDSKDRIPALYNVDPLKSSVFAPVPPKDFAVEQLAARYAAISAISVLIPVLGPIVVNDFLEDSSMMPLGANPAMTAWDKDGHTIFPRVYESQPKVQSPRFQTTLIDAPGINKEKQLPFFRKVLEELPSNEIHAFLLVISAATLVSKDFKKNDFNYYTEIQKVLKKLDPTFAHVMLAVTHAGDRDFQKNMVRNGQDPRILVANRFEEVTGITLSSDKVFFFENQYNCLSKSSVQKLYDCYSGQNQDPKITHAYMHRQKNYQLNVLESFNLLKTVARTTPALSRTEMMETIGGGPIQISGSFVATLQGTVGPVKDTWYYTRVGNLVAISTGSGNLGFNKDNTKGIVKVTGAPIEILPAPSQTVWCSSSLALVYNNPNSVEGKDVSLSVDAGGFNLYRDQGQDSFGWGTTHNRILGSGFTYVLP